MVKKLFIDPKNVYIKKETELGKILEFQYQGTLADEIRDKKLTKDDALEILKEMIWIRVSEEFLDTIKIKGEWKGLPYQYNGPAHMATGQEGAVVGLHWLLEKDDFIFGTHRNHAEVISKGLSSIYKMSDQELEEIMKNYNEGKILEAVNKTTYKFKNIKEKAVFFFMYGFLSEIWGMKQGFNLGLAGSMHLFFTPFGIYPNNAIVGASASLALGAAIFKLTQKKNGISIANIGDGGVSTGPFWETLNFATMDQYKELWNSPYNKRPPFMINLMNNQYGMGGQTVGETMGYKIPARIGAGLNPNNMFSERVNGQDVLATIDLMRRKKIIVEKGDGPVLNEIVTYRYNGHSSGDLESYRTPEEIIAWKKFDPINLFAKQLIENNIIKDDLEIKKIREEIESFYYQIYKLSIDRKITNELDWENNNQVLDNLMFSRKKFTYTKEKDVEVLIKKEQNPRVQRILRRERYAIDKNGKQLSKMKSYQIRDGIFEAILDHYYKEPTFAGWGEELRDWGGAYGVYNGLTESLPYHRLFNSPIAEAAIVGTACGYAIAGGQAIVELEYFDFLFRAGDELSNQLSKWRAMSGGQLKLPVVVRTNIGSQYGVQHSQDYTSVLASITGINLVAPVTPYDAKGLMNTALNSEDPTFFIETQKLYDKGEFFVKEGVPKEYYEIPFGKGVIREVGDDLTIVTLGAALYTALDAAKILKEKYNINSEVIDMRSAVPFDYDIIIDSVKKTGKIILINEGFERMNFMKAVSANLTEFAFNYLDAPPAVLGARNWIMPGADYEKYIYPQVDDILSTIDGKIIKLKDYQAKKINTPVEYKRRAKYGV
ncbi:/ / 2-oxoisovalerate dehydrogenase subunit beta / 390077:392560 Reverse [Candidatus Hepatoplasma crinochetorum]|uniref:/ / 2-oxoisovalerate dehydrogenase subunit beta / 390077:392560 Reverse n=1 Tax=Candidatus Hepatoplasma crinochetorum TaxID=295596 RepID=A0A0G7ZL74_9MOLU|nr:/ / 2-oxoisovalerate dehydrogenase subunit beta / 390077:392560 Reverse [Candidatus Hepatoplasma crinochetorum]